MVLHKRGCYAMLGIHMISKDMPTIQACLVYNFKLFAARADMLAFGT